MIRPPAGGQITKKNEYKVNKNLLNLNFTIN